MVMIKVGIIGVGNWGKNHLRIFLSLPNVDLNYICDLNENTLLKIKAHHPKVFVTQDADELIENVDAVVIASSANTHYKLTKNSLLKGRHVLVEKPLALNFREGEELVKISKKKKVILMVGHLLIYHPAIVKLKEYIEKGELGDIYYLYSQRLNLGRIRVDENVMWSLAPHDISVANYILNAEPLKVSAKGRSYIQKDIEDVAFIDVEYDNGIIAHFHVSWLDPHKIRSLTVVGSRKMAVFDDMQAEEKLKIYDKGVEIRSLLEPKVLPPSAVTIRYGDIFAPKVDMKEPLYLEAEHFINCILNGERPKTDGESALKVLRVLEAANISSKQGGIPQLLK
jgi:predicted dehydrogenase